MSGDVLELLNYPQSYGSESFTYDRVGNRKTHQTRQGENHTYVVDAADQLTEIRDTNTSALLYSFTHDAAGRRTGMTPETGPSTTYEYDARGKLTRLARSDGYSVRLAYGPHGGRYRRQETGFSNAYYLNAWAEHRSDQAVRLVRAGPGGAVVAEISGGMVRSLVRDGLANASHVTVGGTLASVRRYGAFGDILSGPPYPFVERGFAGQQREGRSGLVYMRARHYDPPTGRFLQADPLGVRAHQLYAYAANNPYRFFDPLGLGPISYAEPSYSELPSFISTATPEPVSYAQTRSASSQGDLPFYGSTGAVTLGGNLGPFGGFVSLGGGFDSTGDVAIDLSFGGGSELGSILGGSITGTAEFLTAGGLRESSGPGVEIGGSAYSPFLIGAEVARTFGGTVADLSQGGFDAIGNQSRSTAIDIGAGTPGATAHLFQTFTINAGVNLFTGEFFVCAGGCITCNPFE